MAERDSESSSSSALIIPITIAALFGSLIFYVIKSLFKSSSKSCMQELADETSRSETDSQKPSKEAVVEGKKNAKKAAPLQKSKPIKDAFSHPLLVSTLRGHQDRICDMGFSPDGKFVATCGEDRAIHLWTSADFLTDDTVHEVKNRRLNVELDHASLITVSPDSKALLVKLDSSNSACVLKLVKKPDGHFGPLTKAVEIKTADRSDMKAVDINCNGKFIMTAYANGLICIWSLKGDKLWSEPSGVEELVTAKLSPCGRLMAAFVDSKSLFLWSFNYDKSTGAFDSLDRIPELKGHSDKVTAFAFSGDSTHFITVSADKTFRLYDINVQFKQKEQPRLERSGKWTEGAVNATGVNVALSNNAHCIVISHKTDVHILSGIDGEVLSTINDCVPGPIERVLMDSSSGYILVAGGKLVRVFRNVYGYEVDVKLLREKVKFVSQESTRDRLQKQLEDTVRVLEQCKQRYGY